MGEPRECTVYARLENLQVVRNFIDSVCAEKGIDASVSFALKLAADEACVNIIQHGYQSDPAGQITVGIAVDATRAVITIHDRAPRPFDPNAVPIPDLSSDWETRRIGGLGVYLIQRLVDKVEYVSDFATGNCLTLTKWLRTPKKMKNS
jgi:anti-sigma regulatory factor (Ser/Thr protein kinase)